jgi:hypothetical protein
MVKFLVQNFPESSDASADPDPSSCLGPLHGPFDDIFGAFASGSWQRLPQAETSPSLYYRPSGLGGSG